MHLNPTDVVYYFISVVLDEVGTITESEQVPKSRASDMVECLLIIWNENRRGVCSKVLGPFQDVSRWLSDMMQSKKGSRIRYSRTVPDMSPGWELLKPAALKTAADFGLIEANVNRKVVDSYELIWKPKEKRVKDTIKNQNWSENSYGGRGQTSAYRSSRGGSSRWLGAAVAFSTAGSSWSASLVDDENCAVMQHGMCKEHSEVVHITVLKSNMEWLIIAIIVLWTVTCVLVGRWSRDPQKKDEVHSMSCEERPIARRDKEVQCSLALLDAEEIEKMTIQSIREEIKKHLGDTTGRKQELVVRLLTFRKQAIERREG